MLIGAIVDDYIRRHRPDARADLIEFQKLPTLSQAIRHASLCHWLPSFKRHPHQYRIPSAALQLAEQKLQLAKHMLSQAKTFEILHKEIQSRIGEIHKIGPLAVYDIAHRIGAHLELTPTLVYLHQGTRIGARALGFTGRTLDRRSLPAAFSRLKPYEIEDCLCMYKDELRSANLAVQALERRSFCITRPSRPQRTC